METQLLVEFIKLQNTSIWKFQLKRLVSEVCECCATESTLVFFLQKLLEVIEPNY